MAQQTHRWEKDRKQQSAPFALEGMRRDQGLTMGMDALFLVIVAAELTWKYRRANLHS